MSQVSATEVVAAQRRRTGVHRTRKDVGGEGVRARGNPQQSGTCTNELAHVIPCQAYGSVAKL